MIATIIRCIALAARAHTAFPDQPLDRVTTASCAAVEADAELAPTLLAIAEHESDLEPTAVSWRDSSGRRVDRVVHSEVDRLWVPRGTSTCGLVQSVATDRASCLALLDPIAAMRAGAAELRAWLEYSRGDLLVALGGYSGGTAGAIAAREGRTTLAVRFARLFVYRARRLSPPEPKPRS